ncbi:Ig-like domain-containing protein, partial [Edaphovirga cremea]
SSGMTPGAALVVTVNGKTYNASVLADGSWLTNVSAADVSTWPVGQVNVTVAGSSAIGNPVSSTRVVTVDLSEVAVSINPVASDNVLNAAEHNQALTLSGSTQNVEAGKVVSVVFAGHSYNAIVGNDGKWAVTVPAADMRTMTDGETSVQVSVTNAAGNSASAAQNVYVDVTAPLVTIDPVTSDNVLNAAEVGSDLLLSGTSTAQVGQTVTVTFNGQQYTATVGADGSWSTTVPTADLASLTDHNVTVSATVSDKAGNTSQAARDVLVDITVPTVTIYTVAGDNIINATEHGVALIISGGSSGAAVGDKVMLVIDGHTYTTVLDASGNWSVGVPASVVSGLTDANYRIDVSITDAAGNTGSGQHDVVVDTAAPTLGFNTLAVDNVLNAIEKGVALTVSGSGSNLSDGTIVTITLNGTSYTAQISAGVWSLQVPAADVALLGEATYILTASATNGIGNSASNTAALQVDTALPVVLINPVTSDDVLNAAEIDSGQTLSGRVTGAAAGDTVTVMLGGVAYTTQVNADLSWSVNIARADLTALGNGGLTVSASVTNGHGNTGHGSRDIQMDANLPGLRIDTVAGDDIINAIEHGQNLIISGTSSDLETGSSIQVTLNGQSYVATITANGSWRAAVPAADVAVLNSGVVSITASGTSTAGNPVGIQHNVTVDLNAVAVSIAAVTGDNVINALEKGSDLLLSGSSQNVEAGQTVNVLFAGQSYIATVQANGSWSVTVPSADLRTLTDGDVQVQISVVNAAGNGASAAQGVHVDLSAPALTIDSVTSDNVLNAAEVGSDLQLSGTSTAEAGQTVTVTFNGQQYTATVGADGNWSTTVPAADLASLTDDNVTVSASVSDNAGNTSQAVRDVLVDITIPTVTIHTVAGDDIINATEHGQAQIISGSSSGAAAGDILTLTVGTHTYTTTVDTAGNWSIGVPASTINDLDNGNASLTASLTDAAGNTGSGQHVVVVNTTAPQLSINTLAQDDVINAVEKGSDLLLSGGSNLANGITVTVSLNGKNYTTEVNGGLWNLTVPAADVAQLGEASYTVTAKATDGLGNSGSVDHLVLVDSAIPTVLINPVTSDDVLNAAEIDSGQTLSGRVSGAAAGDTVTVVLGGVAYTTQVNADLSWSVNVAAQDLTALGNGGLTVSASVTNGHGNTGHGSRDITVDANLPGLRIATVAGDDIINAIEHGQNLIVSGTSSGLEAGSSILVTLNGIDYTASINADGSWSAAVPATDVAALHAGVVSITASGTSTAGNPVGIQHNVTVDLNVVAVSIDAVTGDNVLNALEKDSDLLLSGSSQSVEEGQTVNVQFAGHGYTATVQADGSWSVTVPSADLHNLTDGDVQVQVSVVNAAGNGASAAQGVHVDLSAPALTIDNVTSDNVLNAAEVGSDLQLSGTSTAEVGQMVTVIFNGNDYLAQVQANGTWSVMIPAVDLVSLTDSNIIVSASVSDKAGNISSADRNVLVDVTLPTLTIHAVAGDNIINATEHGMAQIISGSSSGAAAGDNVTVVIDGHTYITVLDASGNWSVGVPASVVSGLSNNTYRIDVSITDAAGNTGSASHNVVVNTTAPQLSINTLAQDDVINAVEKGSDLLLSGGSNLANGITVTVSLNGKNYTTEVNGGQWSLTVPAADVAQLGEASYTVTAKATDGVGNSVSVDHLVLVDSAIPAVLINPVTSDDVLNAAEIDSGQTLSGRVTGAAAGDTVTVMLGGMSYATQVNGDLSWSVNVSAQDLTALGNGGLTVSASVTNGHGNTGHGSRDITVDANLPGLRIDTVAGDDIINAIEHGQNLIVSGTSSSLEAGSSILVTLNGIDYTASINADGSWSAAVPA